MNFRLPAQLFPKIVILDLGVVFLLWGIVLWGGFQLQKYMPQEGRRPVAETPARIKLAELKEAQSSGQAIVIDARRKETFDSGHIPGALSLPRVTMSDEFQKVQPQLDRDKLLIVYCSGVECGDADAVAEALVRKYGYPKVAVYRAGWRGWRENEASRR